MSNEKSYHIDIDLTKLFEDAKHLMREGKNGHKYITLTMAGRKEAPSWNEWQTHNISAYDKEGGEGEKNIFLGSAETAIWERPKEGDKPKENDDLKSKKEAEWDPFA